MLCLISLGPLVREPSLSSRDLLDPRLLSRCARCSLGIATLGHEVSLSNSCRSLVEATAFMNESGVNSASLPWRPARWFRGQGLPGFLPLSARRGKLLIALAMVQ
jgi:hypothetical protein